MAQSALVKAITDETERENSRGKGIAGRLRAAAEEFCKDLVAVLCAVLEVGIDHDVRRGREAGEVEPCLATMLNKNVSIRV
jgi:hypothetical protein